VALMLLVLGGAFGSLVLGMRDGTGNLLLPLTALQLLWINFLGDGPPALALSVDRVSDVMQRPPRPRSSALLDRKTLTFTLSDGVFKAVVGLSLLVLLPRLGASLPATAAAVFLYEAVAKLASAYPARSVDSSPGTNVWLHVSIAAGIGLCLLCVTLEPLRRVLALHTTDASTLRVVACAVSLTVLGSELLARVLRRRAIACGLPKASAF
jgi:Ca2+-transporting ATPase